MICTSTHKYQRGRLWQGWWWRWLWCMDKQVNLWYPTSSAFAITSPSLICLFQCVFVCLLQYNHSQDHHHSQYHHSSQDHHYSQYHYHSQYHHHSHDCHHFQDINQHHHLLSIIYCIPIWYNFYVSWETLFILKNWQRYSWGSNHQG